MKSLIACCFSALALYAQGAANSAYSSLDEANNLFDRSRYKEAAASYEQFIDLIATNERRHALNKHDAHAKEQVEEAQKMRYIAEVNLGQCLIAQAIDTNDNELFERGLRLFESRIPLEVAQGKRAVLQNALQEGQSVDGKTIEVLTEYGFGDSVTFLPLYCAALKSLGATVVVRLTRPHHLLGSIFQQTEGIDQIVTPNTPQELLPQSDFQVYAMSLPGLISSKGYGATHPDTVPHLSNAGIKVSEKLVAEYKAQMAPDTLHVAVCWKASKNPVAGGTRIIDRDLPLSDLTALQDQLDFPVKFWSIQGPPDKFVTQTEFEALKKAGNVGKINEETDVIPDAHALRICQVVEDHGPFVDTAAVIDACDVTIGCDTVFPNLAAAMHKVTYFLLKKEQADMRWGAERDDTVWFEHAHVLRQETEGDWKEPLSTLVSCLKELHEAKKNRSA